MGHPHREVIVTIRVDPCLADMLKSMPNRSAFIRDAILDALARRCPACRGAGVLASVDHPSPAKASAERAEQRAPDET